MDKQPEALKLAQDLKALADRFSEGWHEGIKIDASDIMLLADAAEALAEQPAQQQEPVLWLVNGVVQSSDIPKDYTGCLFTSPPAQQQKPVAWMCCVPGQDAVLLFDEPSDEQYPPGYKQPLGRLSQPAQQKPETVYQCLGAGGYWIDQTKDSYDYNVRHGHATVRVLYTSPQPSKPWVGLTDEERRACTQSPFAVENYLSIEAKLKEKNNG